MNNHIQEFLQALDKALELDSKINAWGLNRVGGTKERVTAWAEVQRLRTALEKSANQAEPSTKLGWPGITRISITKLNMGDRWDAVCEGFYGKTFNTIFPRPTPHEALDAILVALGEKQHVLGIDSYNREPVKPLPELIVTKGGVPFTDQAEGIRQFKEACLKPAEPVKEPSDAEILDIAKNPICSPCSPWWLKDGVKTSDVRRAAIAFARALLAKYGQPAKPVEKPSGELAEAIKHWYEQSDGITVCIPSELAQALYSAFTTPIAAQPVITCQLYGHELKTCGECNHEMTQPAANVSNGWKEAAIAWEVCASIHRQWAKGKDALFSTRQSDFIKHANDARAMLEVATACKVEPDIPVGSLLLPKDDVKFIAARLQRLCQKFKYKFTAESDAATVALAGTLIGAVLAKIDWCDRNTMTLSEAKKLLGLPELPHLLKLGDGLSVIGSKEAIQKVKAIALPQYTSEIGEAGNAYMDKFKGYAHPLPVLFRWHELWDAMCKAATGKVPECDHEWTDARNKYVKSGELCIKCHAVRSGNTTDDCNEKGTGK